MDLGLHQSVPADRFGVYISIYHFFPFTKTKGEILVVCLLTLYNKYWAKTQMFIVGGADKYVSLRTHY